jgi:hypothetical protein
MKRRWEREELEQQWGLSAEEWKLLKNKAGPTRLGFAVLMKFFQMHGRFPGSPREVPREPVHFIAEQLDLPSKLWKDYPWTGRVVTYHRNEIRKFFDYRKTATKDTKLMVKWLVDDLLNHEYRPDHVQAFVLDRFRTLCIEPPTDDQVTRLILSALAEHESRFCKTTTDRLDDVTLKSLDTLLQIQTNDEVEWSIWQTLKEDPGKAGIYSIKDAVSRLKSVRSIGLPTDLFSGVSPKLLECSISIPTDALSWIWKQGCRWQHNSAEMMIAHYLFDTWLNKCWSWIYKVPPANSAMLCILHIHNVAL